MTDQQRICGLSWHRQTKRENLDVDATEVLKGTYKLDLDECSGNQRE
jgi:hypothetical protein